LRHPAGSGVKVADGTGDGVRVHVGGGRVNVSLGRTKGVDEAGGGARGRVNVRQFNEKYVMVRYKAIQPMRDVFMWRAYLEKTVWTRELKRNPEVLLLELRK